MARSNRTSNRRREHRFELVQRFADVTLECPSHDHADRAEQRGAAEVNVERDGGTRGVVFSRLDLADQLDLDAAPSVAVESCITSQVIRSRDISFR